MKKLHFITFIILVQLKIHSLANILPRISCPVNCICPTNTFISCLSFQSFNQLNFANSLITNCESLQISPSTKLILDDQFVLIGLDFSTKATLKLENIEKIDIESILFKTIPTKIENLEFKSSNFDFITNSQSNIANQDCSKIQTGDLFTKFNNVLLSSTVQYNNLLCQFIFKDANINQLAIYGLSATNKFNFIDLQSLDLDKLNSQVLKLEIYESSITTLDLNLLDKDVFKSLKELIIMDSYMNEIEETLFSNFKSIEVVYFKLKNLRNIFQQVEWMNHLNISALANPNKQILIGFIETNANGYDFPDRDLCLFKSFPHNLNVFVYIQSTIEKYKCTCTLILLLKNWKSYKNFNLSNPSVDDCLKEETFNAIYTQCNLEQDIKCFPTTTTSTTTTTTTSTTSTTTTSTTTTTTTTTTSTTSTTTTTTTTTTPTTTTTTKKPIIQTVFAISFPLILLILISLILIYLIFIRKLFSDPKKMKPELSVKYLKHLLFKPEPEQLIIELPIINKHCDIYLHQIETFKNFKKKNNFLGYSCHQTEIIERKIQVLIQRDIIVEGDNSIANNWLSSIIVNEEEQDFIIDYRNLNVITVKRTDRISFDINQAIANLKQATVYSIINLNKLYSQIKLDRSTGYKTAFESPSTKKVYYFNTIPFGLCNFLTTLSRVVNLILKDYNNYLFFNDKLIVYSAGLDSHSNDLLQIINEFQINNLNLSDCDQLTNLEEIDIFEHLIKNNQAILNTKKTFKISDLPKPFDTKTVLKFAKFVQNFNKSINNIDFMTNEMVGQLTKNDYKWAIDTNDKWTKIEEKLNDNIKPENMIPTEDFFNYSIQLYSSLTFFGAILFKTTSNTDSIISIRYKKLQNPMKAKLQSNFECIYWCLNEFESYLLNRKCVIYTFSKTYFTTFNSMNDKFSEIYNTKDIEKFLLLQDYDLTISIKENSQFFEDLCKYLECF